MVFNPMEILTKMLTRCRNGGGSDWGWVTIGQTD